MTDCGRFSASPAARSSSTSRFNSTTDVWKRSLASGCNTRLIEAPLRAASAIVPGKPFGLGGSHGRLEATGRGLMTVCDEALKRLDRNRDQTRVVIQGFGSVGSNAARLMHRRGYKIVGVSTSTSGVYNRNGI